MFDFSSTLKIDQHLTLSSCALAAPMAGVMSPVFCRAASDLDLIRNWITPFISISPGSVPSKKSLLAKLEPFRNDKALIVQLLGHDPATLAATAARLAELGVPGINLNFACPSPLVRKNGNGSALLGKPELLEEILHTVTDAIAGRANLSVKIRCGMTSSDEIPTLTKIIQNAGIRFLIAHFRTADEMYDPVRQPLDRLKRLRDLLPDAVLIGNGDIRSRTDAEMMIEKTGCNGIAVGRALISNPFLLKMICLGSDAVATDEDRMTFLHTTLKAARALGYESRKWLKHSFIEFARMGFGADSPVFREIASDPAAFAERTFSVTEK